MLRVPAIHSDLSQDGAMLEILVTSDIELQFPPHPRRARSYRSTVVAGGLSVLMTNPPNLLRDCPKSSVPYDHSWFDLHFNGNSEEQRKGTVPI